MASVELRRIVKRYGAITVIHGVDLSVRDGEFVVFVGPSGCGKSTLLRMISGLESVTEGELRLDGRRVNDVSAAQRGLAMVFQSYALYPHMTVYQNMAFGLENIRTPRVQIDAKVQAAAKLLRLEALLERRPTQLSGGQRQRVLLARALVQDAPVLLLDEPFTGVDQPSAALIERLLSELATEGRGLLIATHDIDQAGAWDRVLCLNRRQVAFGPPDETLTREVLEQTYGAAIVSIPGEPGRSGILPAHHH
jgi:ABC-type sugar transport system ATPase subunit